MKINDYTFIKKWKKEMKKMLKIYDPSADEKKINKMLNEMIEEQAIDTDCNIYNNYLDETRELSLLEVTEFIEVKEPILCASGVMFKQHDQAYSPLNAMTSNFLTKRGAYKKTMYKHMDKSVEASDKKNDPNVSKLRMVELKEIFENELYEYKRYNRIQTLEKIKANSIYGASGLKTSVFFNIHAAISTTLTGQVLISTSGMGFEAFLENNVLFYNMDECLAFITNTLNEKREYNDDDIIDINVTRKDVYERLENTFMDVDDIDERILRNMLSHLSQTDLNRLYYKNNIYDFCRNEIPKTLLREIINKVDTFKDPNKIPEVIQEDLKELYSMMSEYVLYNYEIYDRINRLKYQPRKSTVTIDTDSNFVNLQWWYHFVCDEVLENNEYEVLENAKITIEKLDYILNYEERELTPDELELYKISRNTVEDLENDVTEEMYKVISCMATILTEFLEEILMRYCINANIKDEDKRKLIVMKNEFLNERLVLTTSKKNYASIQLLKEGNVIPIQERLDVKGLDLMKSTVTVGTQTKLQDILYNFVLKPTNINIPTILREIEKFEHEIYEDLSLGGLSYLKPASVLEIENYAKPMSEQGIKAVIKWNILYPKEAISLPDKILILKLNIKGLDDLKELQKTDEALFNTIKDEIYNHEVDQIKNGGLDVIALPQNLDGGIPKWLIPYVDHDRIINDNVGKFEKICYSLGLKRIIGNSKVSHYSNIIEF